MDNKEIAKRIKLAREDLKITQKQVAAYLGKQSSNAISEIERGNVNITAEDLAKIATMFNKPIMFFFGQDYLDEDTEAIIAVIDQISPEEKRQLKTMIVSNIQQKVLAGEIQGDPNLMNDREIVARVLQNLNDGIYALSHQLNTALEARKQLEGILGIKDEKE